MFVQTSGKKVPVVSTSTGKIFALRRTGTTKIDCIQYPQGTGLVTVTGNGILRSIQVQLNNNNNNNEEYKLI